MKDILPELDAPDIVSLLPSPMQVRKIQDLLHTLEPLEGVSLELQKTSTTLCDVRALLDTAIDDHPDLAGRLGPDAEIVECADFETALFLCNRTDYMISTVQNEQRWQCFGLDRDMKASVRLRISRRAHEAVM